MTDPAPGRGARWGTAVLLVPAGAALLGGTVWWAGITTPRAQPAPPPLPARATPAVDPHVLAERAALERDLAAHRRDATVLARRLAMLRTQFDQVNRSAAARIAAAAASAGGAGAPTGGSGTGGQGGGSYSGASGGGSSGGSGGGSGGGYVAPAPAPPPPQVVQAAPPPPPPPPPPATHGGTGASGAKP